MKPRLHEALVVEGRYDRNSLLQVIDGVILETKGFRVFKDRELRELLRFYGETRGVIILTDSDSAGFLIRNHMRGVLPGDRVKHAYIPDIPGKEKRKAHPEILLTALRRAGATFEGENGAAYSGKTLTKADLYAMGLSGRADSAEKRKALALRLGFPEHMTSDALLDAVNTMLLSGRLEQSFFDAYGADHADQQDG